MLEHEFHSPRRPSTIGPIRIGKLQLGYKAGERRCPRGSESPWIRGCQLRCLFGVRCVVDGARTCRASNAQGPETSAVHSVPRAGRGEWSGSGCKREANGGTSRASDGRLGACPVAIGAFPRIHGVTPLTPRTLAVPFSAPADRLTNRRRSPDVVVVLWFQPHSSRALAWSRTSAAADPSHPAVHGSVVPIRGG